MSIAAQARELLAEGLTVSEAAKKLGVPYMRVYMARNRQDPQAGSSGKSNGGKKKKQEAVLVKLDLQSTRFPSWWDVFQVDKNRFFARCPRAQFPHRTQEWFGIQAVIDEAAMMTSDNSCKCTRTELAEVQATDE